MAPLMTHLSGHVLPRLSLRLHYLTWLSSDTLKKRTTDITRSLSINNVAINKDLEKKNDHHIYCII